MRQESTGKPDPERSRATEPAGPGPKRGFFAAAGARLKRVMSGRSEPPPALVPAAVDATEDVEGEVEVSTSVQARARELLQHDRANGAGRVRANADSATLLTDEDEPSRRTSPPPLPSQRMAAGAEDDVVEQPASGVTLIPPQRAARTPAKRPVRDSKSEALRARLGAAKAALAEAQAKRAAEADAAVPPSSDAAQQPAEAEADAETSAPEITVEEADLIELQLEAAEELAVPQLEAVEELAVPQLEAAEAMPLASEPTAEAEGAEPIRTLTIARLLARQGYFERSLSIYDELLSSSADDADLRAEADRVRAKSTKKKKGG